MEWEIIAMLFQRIIWNGMTPMEMDWVIILKVKLALTLTIQIPIMTV